MNITKREPVSVGNMLTEEFMQPLQLTQAALADLMGVSRKTVSELCANKRSITANTALRLAEVFGNTPKFWLNLQQRNDIWLAAETEKPSWSRKRARKHLNGGDLSALILQERENS